MTAFVNSVIEVPLRGLDRIRARLLALTGPWVRPLLRDRGLRVAVIAALGVVGAFAMTAIAPDLLLLYGPLVLGVPHLIADLRYLVVQPGAHRHRGFLWGVAPLLAALLVWPSLFLALAAIASAALVAPGVRPGASWRRGAALGVCGVLGLAVARDPRLSQLVFAHGHNLIAIVFVVLFALRRGQVRYLLPALLLLLAFGTALLSGAVTPFIGGALSRAFVDPHIGELAMQLSPWASPALAVNVLLFYAFAQSLHYASWLRVVPEEARPRPGVRGFWSSYRAVEAELGATVLWVAMLVMVCLGLWAVVDCWASRAGYLRLAFFHGPLELAMLAWFFVRGSWLPIR